MPDSNNPLFDVGESLPDTFEKAVAQAKERGHKPLKLDPAVLDNSQLISGDFMQFVFHILTRLQMLDAEGRASVSRLCKFEVPEGSSLEEVAQEGWNARAKDWPVVESPHNYGVTMNTLAHYIRMNERKNKETFLSLGSGPGLYETFLGMLFAGNPTSERTKLYAVDYASHMTALHRRIINLARESYGARLKNVIPMTDDMTNLQTFDAGVVDQIICNNSLQWVPDWRKGIAEMRRVINPKGAGFLYLFVHPWPMSLVAFGGEQLRQTGDFSVPDLLDELERNCFEIGSMRQIVGKTGTGQFGGKTQRIFVLAQHDPAQGFTSWRNKEVSTAMSAVMLGKEEQPS